MLQSRSERVTEEILPLGSRFSHILVDESRQRRKIEQDLALSCDLLAKSWAKVDDLQQANQWRREAARWDPNALEDRTVFSKKSLDEDRPVELPPCEVDSEPETGPRPWGSLFAGVQNRRVYHLDGEEREEWLESFYLLGIPFFPLRRFAGYKDLNSGEIIRFQSISLTFWNHLRQGVLVLIMSLGLVVLFLSMKGKEEPSQEAPALSLKHKRVRIHQLVERLKFLARRESELSEAQELTLKEEAELKSLREERTVLLKELERLEPPLKDVF